MRNYNCLSGRTTFLLLCTFITTIGSMQAQESLTAPGSKTQQKMMPNSQTKVSKDQIVAAVKKLHNRKKILSTMLAALPESEKPALVTALIPFLRSSEWEEQVNAAYLLGELGPISKPALPDMINAMNARMANVAWEVTPALKKIGAASAVPELIKALSDSQSSKREIHHLMDAFAELGPGAKGAAPYLVPYLNDNINTGAVKALSKIGPSCIPDICKGLDTETQGRFTLHATDVLQEYGDISYSKIANFLRTCSPTGRRNCTYVLAHLNPAPGKSDIPILCKLIKDQDEKVRSSAKDALIKIGPTATPDVLELLVDSEFQIFSLAASILQSYGKGANKSIPLLSTMLTKPDFNRSTVAASTILKIESNNKIALDTLLKYLQDKEISRRIAAAQALANAGSGAGNAVEPLINKLKTDEDPRVRYEVASALGEIGPQAATAVPALINAATAKHPYFITGHEALGYDDNIHRAAIAAIGKIGPKASSAIPALTKILADQQQSYLNEYIYAALSQMKEAVSPAVPALISWLKVNSSSAYECKKIIEVIKVAGPKGKQALPDLRALLKSSQDRGVRLSAFLAIAAIETDPAKKCLDAQELVNDTDYELRAEALKQLAKYPTKDSNTIETLIADLKSCQYNIQLQAIEAVGNAGPLAAKALPILIKENIDCSYQQPKKEMAFAAIKKIDPSGEKTIALVQPALKDCFRVRGAVQLLEFVGSPACLELAKSTRLHWKLK